MSQSQYKSYIDKPLADTRSATATLAPARASSETLQFSFSTDTITMGAAADRVATEHPPRMVTLHENRHAEQSIGPFTMENAEHKNWRIDAAHEQANQFNYIPQSAFSNAAIPAIATPAAIESPLLPPASLPQSESGKARFNSAHFQAPLNSFHQEPQDYNAIKNNLGIVSAETQERAPFSAAMEVEQFGWLPMIDNLCLQHPVALDRILAELKPELQAGRRIVAINSIKQGEGRTTIAQCLARRAAMQGLKTCLIDADHQFPQLTEQLGLEVEIGWEATLTMPYEIGEVAIESVQDDLCFIPLHQPVNNEVLVTLQQTCIKWLDELKTEFDLVILDTAPLLNAVPQHAAHATPSKTHPLAAWPIDHWLIVRNVQETTLAEVQQWQRHTQSLNLNILGLIENRTKLEVPASVYQG